ncbi:MAG: photosynthetic complex assembly protein PuhC [Gemmobacter sp.]
MTTRDTPARKEMIPKVLLRGMLALALGSLALVTFGVLTDRPLEGVPAPAAVLSERTISLIGGGAQAVTVLDDKGTVIADMAHGGFVTVVQNGLQTARKRHGIDPARPIRLVEYADGRLTMVDPDTGTTFELHAFGADNEAAFRKLLN